MNSCVTVFGLYIGSRKKDKQKIKHKLTREKKKKSCKKNHSIYHKFSYTLSHVTILLLWNQQIFRLLLAIYIAIEKIKFDESVWDSLLANNSH